MITCLACILHHPRWCKTLLLLLRRRKRRAQALRLSPIRPEDAFLVGVEWAVLEASSVDVDEGEAVVVAVLPSSEMLMPRLIISFALGALLHHSHF